MSALGSQDVDFILDLLDRVGKQVVLPGFADLANLEVRAKTDDQDLVTEADIRSEEALSEALAARFPGAFVVGEERVAADPSALDGLGEAELGFLIDPIDGTWNYAHGLPLFGMMIAATSRGCPLAGFLHFPLTGDAIWGLSGAGAFYRRPGTPRQGLQVAKAAEPARMSGTVALALFPAEQRETVARRSTAFQRTPYYRCSAYEYRMIASGHLHFSLNSRLKPWDHVAGVLIHQEAGGHSGMLDGAPYDYRRHDGALLLAPDEASWSRIRTIYA